jgi:hypothetical protein
MSPRTLPRCALLLMVLFALDGCVPPGGGRELIGELGVDGPNVFLNGAQATAGTTIYFGDIVTTGPDSSAMILFFGGGAFQLDQNTDPIFSWATYESVRCVLVKIVHGQGYVDNAHTCINSPIADAVAQSEVNLAVSPSSSVLTLLEGTLIVARPVRMVLAPGQEVTVEAGARTPQVRLLSPAELQERVAWRNRFHFQGWCDAPGGVHPAYLGDCPGRFSFGRPVPPPPPPLPFLRFSPFGVPGSINPRIDPHRQIPGIRD